MKSTTIKIKGHKINRLRIIFALAISVFFFLFSDFNNVHAASIRVSPSVGSFVVGSTFEISLFLNSEDDVINAIEVSLDFPEDKLQLVSPSAGKSIIELWTAPPKFNNNTGRVDFRGGIPGGTNVSNGLVMRLTFRVRSVGTAIIKLLDNTKVLRHDGHGTDVLSNTSNSILELLLPPPLGPQVTSATHPDQSHWYSDSNVQLTWASDTGGVRYSYIIDNEPVTVPDNITDGENKNVAYTDLSGGIYYFHIKAIGDGEWGGTTHYAIKIDTIPPAAFPINVQPAARTIQRNPLVEFDSTDSFSGIDHYELKLIPVRLSKDVSDEFIEEIGGNQPFFIEVQSPYITPKLELGSYDVIVRAYDRATNYREVKERIEIVTKIFEVIKDEGIQIKNKIVIPWFFVWLALGVVLVVLGIVALEIRHLHKRAHRKHTNKELPSDVSRKLDELKKYKKRYGDKALLLLLFLSTFVFGHVVQAQSVVISPPVVLTSNQSISNEEIFYIGGRTQIPKTDVIIFLQNLQSGETTGNTIQSNEDGEWFYRHSSFLPSGNFLLWVQGRAGEELSPPSPQILLQVQPTAIQFGSSRISLEALYLGILIVVSIILLILLIYIFYHGYKARKKHGLFLQDVKDVEDAVMHGFAILKRDIQAELDIVRKAKLSKSLSAEEKIKEDQLLKDIDIIEKNIGKEILDIEKY